MFNEINCQTEDEKKPYQKKKQKKITPERLKNIALYYLKRFESSVQNLRQVLQKRVLAYAKENQDFDKKQAFEWIENILSDFIRLNYLNDKRFAEIKIRAYLNAGKPERYIKPKLKQKGISESGCPANTACTEEAFHFTKKSRFRFSSFPNSSSAGSISCTAAAIFAPLFSA